LVHIYKVNDFSKSATIAIAVGSYVRPGSLFKVVFLEDLSCLILGLNHLFKTFKYRKCTKYVSLKFPLLVGWKMTGPIRTNLVNPLG
jgi:hypothetical protein